MLTYKFIYSNQKTAVVMVVLINLLVSSLQKFMCTYIEFCKKKIKRFIGNLKILSGKSWQFLWKI